VRKGKKERKGRGKRGGGGGGETVGRRGGIEEGWEWADGGKVRVGGGVIRGKR